MKMLKPYVEDILYNVIPPIMHVKPLDVYTFENEPVDFIRDS